jgi:hypothetical protein
MKVNTTSIKNERYTQYSVCEYAPTIRRNAGRPRQ